jgi:hypothetical protein
LESLNRIEKVERLKERTISNKLLKDIAQMLKENNDILKRKEKLLIEIKDEIRKIKFNTRQLVGSENIMLYLCKLNVTSLGLQ